MPQHRVSGEASLTLAVTDQILREILSHPHCQRHLAPLIQAKLDSINIRFARITDDRWTSIELENHQLGVTSFAAGSANRLLIFSRCQAEPFWLACLWPKTFHCPVRAAA